MEAFKSLPSDSAFQAAFSIATISKQSLARFYLRSLEEGLASPNEEQTPSSDTGKVNLEHVLPATPTPEWEALFSKDEFRAYQKRLGNLAIMASKLNSKAGNDSFPEKCKMYSQSSFYFTKIIKDQPTWNKVSIENRQAEMAKVAVKVWSV